MCQILDMGDYDHLSNRDHESQGNEVQNTSDTIIWWCFYIEVEQRSHKFFLTSLGMVMNSWCYDWFFWLVLLGSEFDTVLFLNLKSLFSTDLINSVKSGLWTRLELGSAADASAGIFGWSSAWVWLSTHGRIFYASRYFFFSHINFKLVYYKYWAEGFLRLT